MFTHAHDFWRRLLARSVYFLIHIHLQKVVSLPGGACYSLCTRVQDEPGDEPAMPPPTKLQQQRREAITEIVTQKRVESQDEIVRLLAERGITATQASVSRDLRALGAWRLRNQYYIPVKGGDDGHLKEVAHLVEYVKPAGDNLTILYTREGAAPMVVKAFNEANLPHIAALFAADVSTVLLVTVDGDEQDKVLDRLEPIFMP